MQQLRFINSRGAEVTFNSGPPFVFWKIDGINLMNVETPLTQAPGQNGYTLHNILLDSRTIHLSGHVHGKSGIPEMYEKRKELHSVCNPLLGVGKLIYENDHGSWQIAAFCTSIPYVKKIREVQTLDINFECPSPLWMTTEAGSAFLAYVEGGLEFPLVTPGEFGILGYLAKIDNDGDANMPVEMWIDGGSLNPVITNITTGEFIKLSKDLKPYDKLYINTDPENIEVSLITTDTETNEERKEKAYGYLSQDSDLFTLIPGLNQIEFMSDDENKKVRIKISYYKRYVGV